MSLPLWALRNQIILQNSLCAQRVLKKHHRATNILSKNMILQLSKKVATTIMKDLMVIIKDRKVGLEQGKTWASQDLMSHFLTSSDENGNYFLGMILLLYLLHWLWRVLVNTLMFMRRCWEISFDFFSIWLRLCWKLEMKMRLFTEQLEVWKGKVAWERLEYVKKMRERERGGINCILK